jgi:hypothetical protein
LASQDIGAMTSDSHDVLADGTAEWKRAEEAVSRLIAAHHNLSRDDGDVERTDGSHPSAAMPGSEAAPIAQPSSGRWMTVVLLAALWLSIGLVVSAAIFSVAMLL